VEVSTSTSGLTFRKYGEAQFDTLILFGVQEDVPQQPLLDFVDSNKNVIIISKPAGDSGVALPESLREAAIDCGVFFSDTNVVDNFKNTGKSDEIVSGEFVTSKALLPHKLKDITYKGLGIQLEKHNPLLIPIVTARHTAYTPVEDADEDEEGTPLVIGKNIVLAAGLQTRLGSRMAFIGSTLLFDGKNDANTAFAKSVLEWVTGRRGVLRYSDVHHHKINGSHEGYRIRDYLHYSIKIEEHVDGKWVPYHADDVQLEFTMIDPYIRQSLHFDKKKNDGSYLLEFQAPDVYGIYKFHIDYRRVGYTLMQVSTQATVRPLRLNEYERFIPSAFPYYGTVFSCFASFFIFVLIVVSQ